MDEVGHVYVTDSENYRVQIFDASGAPLHQWGAQGSGEGQFNLAYGVAVNSIGRYVFVADTYNNRVQMFVHNAGAGAPDSDQDGVADASDACPGEDASYFDRDGDGCIDTAIGARHVEYWSVEDDTVTYYISEDGAPNITDGSDMAAIVQAMTVWTTLRAIWRPLCRR
ncbi:MAG: hypothetical protein HY770_00665 [Chitinivibrionia bacterium]|nr:hypothetical protein [Chitinivibrionia bacterium]